MSESTGTAATGTSTGTAAQGTQQSAGGTSQAGTTQSSSSDWTSGFNDEMKGYIQNKGFKGAQDLADSYRNFEKSMGVPQDRLLKLPESMESPEAKAIWKKLGMPEDAKGYNLKVPDKGGDPKLAEWAADVFHKGNLTSAQADSVMAAWNARQEAVNAATVENQKISLSQANEKLKTEWGAAYDKNINLAKSGMMALELDGPKVDALEAVLGREQLFKTLSKIGAGVGEASFVQGRPAGDGTMTPEQARVQLEDLKRDQGFVQKYLSGDFDAKKRMEGLQKMANPGDTRLS